MADNEFNPYSPPKTMIRTENRIGCNIHQFEHGTIYVRAAFLASRLWLIGGFSITTDAGECFSTAQWSKKEDFQWTMQSEGGSVECRLETTNHGNVIFEVPYLLTIGDGKPTAHLIKIGNAWGQLLHIPMVLLVIALILYFF